MTLTEIYDTKVDITYTVNGNIEYGAFKVDDLVYMIQFEGKPGVGFSEQLKGKKVVEVSFHRADIKGDSAFGTTGDTKSTTAIYGVVVNAAIDKFKDYDAYYATIEPRHSVDEKQFAQKHDIYEFLMHRVQKRTGATLYYRKNGTATDYLLSKIELADADDHNFVDLHEELRQAALAGPIAELKRPL